MDKFDYMCFHAPTCKLVSKSYARLLYNDFLTNPENPIFAEVPADIKNLTYEQTITDKTVEKTFMALAKKRFAARVQPSIQVPTMCGNMYCGSVYGSLVSLIANVSSEDLQGKRVGIFSYGSGLAASMFSLKVRGSTEELSKQVDLHTRLDSRRTVAPEVYDEMCNLREKAHLKSNFEPTGSVETLLPGTYYLTKVDEMFRRKYEIKQ
jgi:hydroxymethylglutaryl-CoA synthase